MNDPDQQKIERLVRRVVEDGIRGTATVDECVGVLVDSIVAASKQDWETVAKWTDTADHGPGPLH
jgi:hypothetical protein